MGNATLEIKLLQQVAALWEAILHAIFLNMHKAYDALDRYRFFDILGGYSMGPQSCRILHTY